MNIRECDEMLAAVRRAGIKFKIIENFIFYPPYRKAKELIDRGEIGAVRSVRIRLGSGGAGGWWVPLNTWLWRLAETDIGGGPTIFDDGYHKFSVGIMFGGEVESVFAWMTVLRPDRRAASFLAGEKRRVGVSAHLVAQLHVKYTVLFGARREITGTGALIWIPLHGQLWTKPRYLYRTAKNQLRNLRTDCSTASWIPRATSSIASWRIANRC
jgi:predicted dehydrogenase